MKLKIPLFFCTICTLTLPLWANNSLADSYLTDSMVVLFIISRFLFELPLLWFFTRFSLLKTLVASIIINGTLAAVYFWIIPHNIIFLFTLITFVLFGIEFLTMQYVMPFLMERHTCLLTKRNILVLLGISFTATLVNLLTLIYTHDLMFDVPFVFLFVGSLCLDPGYRIVTYIVLFLDLPIIFYVTNRYFWKTIGIMLVLTLNNLFVFTMMMALATSCDSYHFSLIKRLFNRYDTMVTPFTLAGIRAIILLIAFAGATGLISTYVDVKILKESFNTPTTRKIFYWLSCANILSAGTLIILMTQVRINFPIL